MQEIRNITRRALLRGSATAASALLAGIPLAAARPNSRRLLSGWEHYRGTLGGIWEVWRGHAAGDHVAWV